MIPNQLGFLKHAPSQTDLERLYYELARHGAVSVGRRVSWNYKIENREMLLALAGEMLRFDARLLSILLQWILEYWHTLNPLALRRQMTLMRWPQALAVVLSFAEEASTQTELRYLISYLNTGWPRIDPEERFFIDASRPGSRMLARQIGRNLKPYAVWGFWGVERPTADAFTKRTIGRYDAATRQRILQDLAISRKHFSLIEYLEAVDHGISRQQALADLKRSTVVKLVGQKRGAKWVALKTQLHDH